jgi:hypothetical protein
MRNKLQYVYSITVFLGVLVTAYLMMNREGGARIPLRTLESPVYRTETMVVDPALNQLFEVEDALSKVPTKPTPEGTKRVPAKAGEDR